MEHQKYIKQKMSPKILENHKKVGRPSTLTRALTFQIRSLYLSGQNIKNIQTELNINPSTWDGWYYENIQGFRDNLISWKREKILNQAELNLEEFSTLPTEIQEIEDSDSENGPRVIMITDPRLLRIKLDATTYALDTLGKEIYSKKIIQEDPNATTRQEMDELRQNFKKMMSDVREKNHGDHKEKMLAVI